MYLSFPVDSNDPIGGVTGSCDKDGVTADPVHVDACARLQVKHVDLAKLCDHVDHVIPVGYVCGIGMGRGKSGMAVRIKLRMNRNTEKQACRQVPIIHTCTHTHTHTS